jgi:transposase-like protein
MADFAQMVCCRCGSDVFHVELDVSARGLLRTICTNCGQTVVYGLKVREQS